MKKKKSLIFIILVLISFSLFGCSIIKEEKLEIYTDISGYNIFVGDEITLSTNASDIGAGKEYWQSANTAIATVDPNGNLKALSPGTVYVYVTAGSQIATLKFQVYDIPTSLDVSYYLTSDLQNIKMYVGDACLLKCNDKETDELITDVTWNATGDVVSVSSDGLLIALKPGNGKVYCAYGDTNYSLNIEVLSKGEDVSLTISGSQTVQIDSSIELDFVISDSNYTGGVEWSTNDASIAIVDANGVVRGVSGGLCTIKATSKDDSKIYGEYLVYVVPSDASTSSIVNEIYKITGNADFTSLSDKVVKIIEDNYNAVVGIANYQTVNKTLVTYAVGTGMVYKKTSSGNEYTYLVLTNNHVIDGAEEVKIYYKPLEQYIDASVLAANETIDLAVVTFTTSINITPVEFASSDDYKTGEFVLAIGHPTGFNYYNSATFGTISCANRILKNDSTVYIQHDAAINSGNSGGPLFDMNGKVIGVNTLKLADSGVDNMGFAVSLNTIKNFLQTNNLQP